MWYQQVPKDQDKNLVYRTKLVTKSLTNRELQLQYREMCRRDLLFWVNTFCWTYDPRKPAAKRVVPFITWPYQDECLLKIEKAINTGEDVLIEKSRDMGASWQCLLVFVHQWQFVRRTAFGLVSRLEGLVDKTGDPDSLMWKVDFILENQPAWLLPRYERLRLHFRNLDLESTIDGYSTTGNVMTGGRKTAVLLDEFAKFEHADGHQANASTHAVTDCRVFNSTYFGATGAFYEQAQRTDIIKARLHWSDHPKKRVGLYEANGKQRSPWYDKECRRLIVPGIIAQELDIDPSGSASMFFPADLLDRLLREDVREPFLKGRLEFESGPPSFLEDGKGPLWLWMFLNDGRPKPGESYVVGADIAAGTGATNSVLAVADRRTGEKVAELASANLSPDRFADTAVAVAHWFNDAYLIWESNGPGGIFGKRVIDLGCRNVYYRQEETGLRKALDASIVPGWHSSTETKRLLFSGYVQALGNGRFINRCREAVQECRQYVYLPNGSIDNARKQAVTDPSGARENHGDRPTADALACKGLYDTGPVKTEVVERPPILGSFAWAVKEAKKEEQAKGQWESSPESRKGWANQLSRW